MTDQEHDVEDLIAALRDDLPSRDDERRVCTRLATAGIVVGSVATLAEIGSAAASAGVVGSNSAAVAAGSGAAVAGGTALGTSGSLSMAAGGLAGQGSVAAQGGALAVVFAKVAALGGGAKVALVTALAVGAGYPAVTTLLPPAEPVVASVPAAAARAPEQRAVRAAEGQPASERQPRLEQPEQPPVREVAAETSRVEARTPNPPAVARSRAAAPAAPQATEPVEASPQAVVRTSALEAETALIERALRAVRAGDRDGALGWLSEHQRRYPNGALAPERQRALERLQH